MKKLIILAAITATFFSSCKTSQLASTNDDVYINPAEEKKAAQLAAAEQAKKDSLEQQKVREAQAAQKAKDDANPYYKDPEYNKDDYYDYQYASRVNRFQTPVAGASYYDPYYTNLYTYNQNPANYGTSIYSTYNYGMPSNQFNNYSMGISTGYGYNSGYGGFGNNYGYNNYGSSFGMSYGYNNYGYNSYYNDPFYNNYGGMGYYGGYNNYGYNGFNTGYNMGYYNGYNNAQWGYYNSYDPNSAYGQVQNSPRGSNGGGMVNTSSAGRAQAGEDGRTTYLQSVANQQNATPRFANPSGRSEGRNTGSNGYSGGQSNNGSSGSQNNDRFTNQRNQNQPDNNQNNSNNRQSDRNTNNQRNQENNNSQNRSNNGGWNNSNSGGGGNMGGGGGGGRNSGGGGGGRRR